MKKVGIYSGVFDPIHHGHISFARKAAQELGLDKVFFMPESDPRRKSTASDIRHRLNMLWLALKDFPELELLPHHHGQFTVNDTLPWIEDKFEDADLHLLMGTDLFNFIHTWPGFDHLKHRVNFVVGKRNGHTTEGLESIHHNIIETSLPDVSSTLVRELSQPERSSYIPEDVAKYISAQQLYR